MSLHHPHDDDVRRPHFELFVTHREGRTVRVPCRCGIGKSHTYADWVDAGRPNVEGYSGTEPISSDRIWT